MFDDETNFKKIVSRLNIDDKPSSTHRENLRRQMLSAFGKTAQQPEPKATVFQIVRRTIMKSKITRFAAAAVVAMAVLTGVTFWPRGSSRAGKWWLVPSAAAKEITASLDTIEALVYRQQVASGGRYSSAQHLSGSWMIYYKAKDRQRKDQYYGHELVSTEWSISEGRDLVQTIVSFEFECYEQRIDSDKAYERDPVAELRSYVELLDRADRIHDTETFEGQECVGFEVDPRKRAGTPHELSFRIWLDLETKLPVRVETHGLPLTDLPGQTAAFILDQFEYYVELPVDMFTPEIPEGFIHAHPDVIRAAREKEEKGRMLYADVPPEWKPEIVAALNKIETVTYWQDLTKMYLSRNAWRKDSYDGQGQLRMTEWFVIETDTGKTSFDSSDTNFLLTQTIVNFADNTYKVVTYGRDSRPGHPIDAIWFPVGYVDQADRILENIEMEGIECFGLEISAKKYGTNPDGMLHRLWFDVETKLPVRMEFEWLRDDGTKAVIVKDQFEWNPELSTSVFIPEIPPDFTFVEPNQM